MYLAHFPIDEAARETAPSGVNDFPSPISGRLLSHSFGCSDPDCKTPMCASGKLLVSRIRAHAEDCPLVHGLGRSNPSRCSICKLYQGLLRGSSPVRQHKLTMISQVETDVEEAIHAGADMPPVGLCCPITHDVMRTPVISVACAHIFEQDSICTWLGSSLRACPLCRAPLSTDVLFPSPRVGKCIDAWNNAFACRARKASLRVRTDAPHKAISKKR